MSYRHDRQGFTLIEILVVVAIIALLIGILLPSLARAREQTRNTVCRSDMHQLMSAELVYAAEHRGLPLTLSTYKENAVNWGAGCWWPLEWDPLTESVGFTWDGAPGGTLGTPERIKAFELATPEKGTLFKYVREAGVYLCPSDKPGAPTDTPDGGGGNGQLSYSMNAYIGGKTPESLKGFRFRVDEAYARAGEYISWSASEMMVLFEEHPLYHINDRSVEGNFNFGDRLATRHNLSYGGGLHVTKGRSNIAFLDGHVEGKLYNWETSGSDVFDEMRLPHDRRNLKHFIARLPDCP